MEIPANETWVVEKTNAQNQQITNLSKQTDTPETFDSLEAIETYVQNTFDIGTYYILGVEQTVEVTPTHEMYADYTEHDLTIIENARTTFEKDDRVWAVKKIDDPTQKEIRVNTHGTELSLTPYNYDLKLTVKTEAFENDNQAVLDWVAQQAPNLRILGSRKSTAHKGRGGHGETVRIIALKRDVAPVTELLKAITNVPGVKCCVPANAPTFISKVTPTEYESQQLLITDVEPAGGSKKMGDDPSPQNILDAMNDNFPTLNETLKTKCDWNVSDIGIVMSSCTGSLYRLAIGVQTHNQTY